MSRKVLKRGFLSIGGGILSSRILGYLRDVLIAWWVPTRMRDIFFLTFLIPNLSRRILGEGALATSFYSLYPRIREKEGEKEAKRFSSTLFLYLVISLCIFTVLGFIFAPLIIRIFAPGFSPGEKEIAISLLRLIISYALLICISVYFSSYLNIYHTYISTSLSFVLFNLSLILFLFYRSKFSSPLTALGWGILAGGFLQIVIHLPFLKKKGFLWKPSLFHPRIRDLLPYFLPALLSAGIYYINIAVDRILASFLPAGSISALYYSNRLIQLPLGITGISLSMVSFPLLSRESARENWEGFSSSLTLSLRWLLLINLPVMVYYIALGKPLISILFERGEFTSRAVGDTYFALIFYSLGLYFFTANRLLQNSLYSLDKPWLTLKLGSIALLVNVSLSIILMFPLKQGGLALATSISSFSLFLLQWRAIRVRGKKKIFEGNIFRYLFTFILLSLLAFSISFLLRDWWNWSRLVVTVLLSGGIYLLLLRRWRLI